MYLEELNPDNPQEYRTPDGWSEFETRGSIIKVKDEAPITLTLRWTENGPVIPASVKSLGTITPRGHVTALRWTVLSPNDTSLTAAFGIMQAETVQDAIAAMEDYIAPAQNLTLADRDTIAMKTVGVIPSRDANHLTQGRLPSFGYMPQNRWQGRMPYASNLSLIHI